MADRSDFMYRQKVTEAEMDEAFDDLEDADHNLAVDIGLEGIIEGAVITQNSPLGMSVLASASCRAYDQAGQRIYYAPQQVVDCSQDYNGVSTTPAAGKYATLMLTIAFDRLLDDLRTDGNGASVYYRRYESFEIKVTKGVDAAASPSTPPSAPSDELILCDIEIQDTTTQITNAMIDTSRRQDFQWTDADKIGVAAGSWTKIDSTSDHVQDALDSVDDELLLRDGSGYINQDLIPTPSGSRNLGQAGDIWGDIRCNTGQVSTSWLPTGNGRALGGSSNRWDAYVTSINVLTSILANATGVDIGSASARFDAFLEVLTVYNKIVASSDGMALGDATNRFSAFLSDLTYYGALSGTLQFDAAESVTVMIPVSDFTAVGGSGWAWNSACTNLEESTGSKVAHIRFNIPDGVTLTSMRIRWAMASTGGMTAEIESVDADNSPSAVGSSKSITTYDGSTNWDVIASGLSESGSRADKYHRVKVTSSGAIVQKVYMLEATFGITDILRAALKNCS